MPFLSGVEQHRNASHNFFLKKLPNSSEESAVSVLRGENRDPLGLRGLPQAV